MVKRRFKAKNQKIIRDLQRVMARLGATTLKIEQDYIGKDPTAKITFDRGGVRYVSSCSTFPHYLDNLRAAQLAVEYTWRIAGGYGVDMLEDAKADDLLRRIFGTLEATLTKDNLLLGDGSGQWWEVLGVSKDASEGAVENAYRALSKVHHPDVGGDKEDFIRLQNAYEQGVSL